MPPNSTESEGRKAGPPSSSSCSSSTSLRVLLIDNYDSFTYNLYQIIANLEGGRPPVVLTNDTPWERVKEVLGGVDAVVIGPGPGHPAVSLLQFHNLAAAFLPTHPATTPTLKPCVYGLVAVPMTSITCFFFALMMCCVLSFRCLPTLELAPKYWMNLGQGQESLQCLGFAWDIREWRAC